MWFVMHVHSLLYIGSCIDKVTVLDVNFDILVIVFYIFWMWRRLVIGFRCQYPTKFNSLGHCMFVHQGNISAAAGLEPGTLALTLGLFESTTIPMSYPTTTIYIYVYYVYNHCKSIRNNKSLCEESRITGMLVLDLD